MSVKGFTFRERHSRQDYGIVSRTPSSLFPPIENKLVDVPGGHGAYLFGHRYGVRVLTVPIEFVWKDLSDYQSRINILTEWLSPGTDAEPLVFDMEPDRTYYAKLDDSTDLEKIGRLGQGELTFICPDPFKYGREQSQPFSSSAMIPNEGTMNAYPIFDLTITEDSTLVYISNSNDLTPQGEARTITLGQTKQIDYDPVDPKTLILHDTMRSTSSWQGATEVDNGVITGLFGVDQNGFFVEDWGEEEGLRGWIGPSLRKSFSKTLNSFQADIYIENRNSGNQVAPSAVGIIEVYLRDANGRLICKIGFGDSVDNASINEGVFVTSGKRYPMKHDNLRGWNNFNGILRIVRDSNEYFPYIAMINKNGEHTDRRALGRIRPVPGMADARVSTFQIAMRKYSGADRMYQRIKEIKVYDMVGTYEYPDRSTPIRFKAGDRLKIDTKGWVLLNGEPRNDLISLETDFFSLVEGLNTLEFSKNVTGEVKWRNRYL